MKKGLTF